MLQGPSGPTILMVIALLVVLTLAGCAGTPTTEYVYVEPDCQVPAIVDPVGWDWADLEDVPITTLEDMDETVQTLIDQILVRQAMLEEICGP